ncbi:hypothetical protein Lfu02_40430 [Longispora fulva]|uniref:Uncharacterized protein n=1 Tax=Longispora fulva TaxID=619741 RepID=A0A8J7GSX5_9ACTN|nr:hypothetical protein [Longispora fulva]MBG6136501.1 hypothetical protein [Longispora fulva]GIG59671.1 hypothetical protein Lfu02_40430 [Longispora fulva]
MSDDQWREDRRLEEQRLERQREEDRREQLRLDQAADERYRTAYNTFLDENPSASKDFDRWATAKGSDDVATFETWFRRRYPGTSLPKLGMSTGRKVAVAVTAVAVGRLIWNMLSPKDPNQGRHPEA